MASENTYAEMNFHNEWTSSGTNSDSPTEKDTPHKCHLWLPKLLLASALIILLLKTIFLSVVINKKVSSCCPRDWKLFSSSCYYFSTDLGSWNESEKNCSRMAAHLVVINSQEEQDFIINNLKKDASYYLGLFDPDCQNHWQWVDQTPYNQSATFWHLNEPNRKDECCAEIRFRRNSGEYGWNDVPCHEHLRSICEMKKTYI